MEATLTNVLNEIKIQYRAARKSADPAAAICHALESTLRMLEQPNPSVAVDSAGHILEQHPTDEP